MKMWIALGIMSCSFVAQAGVTLLAEEASGSMVTKTYFEGDQVRVDIDDGDKMSIYFDAATSVFRMVNHADRSYMEMDKATIQQMTAAMDQAMAQMQESLKGLPPEQAAMMKRMMGGVIGDMDQKPPEHKIVATNEKRAFDGVPCKRYNQLLDGELVTEFWVASFDDLKISKDDVGALQALSEMQQELMSSMKKSTMAATVKAGTMAFEEMEGLPMVTKVYQDGRVTSETFIRQVTPGRLGPELFALPQGYRKQEMPTMPTERPGGKRPFNIPRF